VDYIMEYMLNLTCRCPFMQMCLLYSKKQTTVPLYVDRLIERSRFLDCFTNVDLRLCYLQWKVVVTFKCSSGRSVLIQNTAGQFISV